MGVKARVNKWDMIELESFCTAKEMINKVKMQSTEREKIFEMIWLTNGSISKYTVSSYSSVTKTNLIKKMCRRPRHFFREDIQRASRCVKRCSGSLSMREMQIKTTVRHHLALIRMTISKKTVSSKCWRGCGEERSLVHYWWEGKLVQLLWKTVWNFL